MWPLVRFLTRSRAALNPATAEPILSSFNRTASYEDAKTAYDAGDKNLALAYGKIAANNGDTEAQILVGHILMRGETGLIDYNGAAEVFQKAALKDDTDALVALSELALRSQGGLTPPQAISYLERAAELGRHDAMRVLATVYETGDALPQDLKQAKHWRGKAAMDGDALAARAMGDNALKDDAFEALTWYEHAATLGDAQSAYIAAIMYAENYEIRPDEKKAARLMQQAARANLPVKALSKIMKTLITGSLGVVSPALTITTETAQSSANGSRQILTKPYSIVPALAFGEPYRNHQGNFRVGSKTALKIAR